MAYSQRVESHHAALSVFARFSAGVSRVSISVIIAAYNEGSEVAATVESVRTNTRDLKEVLVVDDASSDGSCAGLEGNCVGVIRIPRGRIT